MGLDRPGITPTKRKPKVRRKAPRAIDRPAASREQVPAKRKTVKRTVDRPTASREQAPRRPAGPTLSARAGVGARGTFNAKDTGPLRRVSGKGRTLDIDRKASSSALRDLEGVGRVLGHTTRAIAKTVYDEPVGSVEKSAKQAGEIAKGVASAAIALPAYTVTRSTGKVLGLKPAGDDPVKISKRMIDAEGKRLSKTYGPSYRGEKGAAKRLEEQVKEEGPLLPALDVATVVAPTSIGLGAGARQIAKGRTTRGTKPGAIGKLVNRKPVRITPLGAPTARAPRRGLAGMAASATRDAARGGVQRAAVARSKRTGKALPARRALLKPGEVTPISPLSGSKRVRIKTGGVNRKLRVSTAQPIRRADATAARRVQRHVTDTSKHADSLRKAFKGLPEPLHHAAITAGKLGILDAKGARAIITLHIAEIERTVKAARADPKHPDHAAASRDDAHLDELAKLHAYLKDPAVFERADVQRAANAPGIRRPVVGPREGLGPDRAETGRAGLLGGTLGVKTAKEANDAARTQHKAVKRQVRTETTASIRQAERNRLTAERKAATKDRIAAREYGRAEILTRQQAGADKRTAKLIDQQADALADQASRLHKSARANMMGVRATNPLKDVGTLTKGQRRYRHKARRTGVAQQGVKIGSQKYNTGKRQERRAIEMQARVKTLRAEAAALRGATPASQTKPRAALSRLERSRAAALEASAARAAAEAALKTVKEDARTRRKAANTRPRVIKESGTAHAARVDAEAAKLGLAPPAHVRSEFKRADDELRVQHEITGEANPTGKERKGTLYRTGRENKTLDVVEASTTANLRKGARLEARSQIIADHAKTFTSPDAANKWAKQHGLDTTENGDMVIAPIPNGMARKGLVTPRPKKSGRPDPKSDAGDYVKTSDVMLLPKVVYREMIDQADFAAKPPNIVKQTLAQSQAALLALNPAWWQFQRVNDTIAATMGGSLQHTAALEKARRALRRDDPDAYEKLATMSGGSMSREMLTPHSAQTMGRYKKILDENPTYRDALRSDTPATALLLRAGKNLPTALLRSDQAITGAFRERQLLHELRKVARKMDPDVKAVNRAFDPIGQAFKTGDINAISKLLKDPAYQRQLADATERLDRIHGDWSTYTARELNTKQYAAFYGFLRYSTRMALFTLPLGHPTMGLLIARLGQMGAQDAKAIIGPDMPWGLGTLYNADGTIAADFIRANPITGPLLSINKPEQLVGLSTPLASIVLSTALGQSIGLSDSSAGYTDKHTVKGDPKDTAIGGFFSTERGRILLAQTVRMLGPVSEWQRFDERVQTDDSLPWNRRIAIEPAGTAAAARLAAKNANRVGGVEGLLHNTLPLAFPGSSVNRRLQGQTVTAARTAAKQKEAQRKVRRIQGAQPRGGGTAGGDFFGAPAAGGTDFFE